MSSETFYTVAQVAQRLKISPRLVQQWCKSGQILAYQVGNRYRVPHDALESFKRSHKVERRTVDVGEVFEGEFSALVAAWIYNMEHGPRPYSRETIRSHNIHMKKYLRVLHEAGPIDARLSYHDALSEKALLRVLSRIPITQYATRYNVFMAVMCLCNFLITKGILDAEVKTAMKPHKPKRLLPPKRKSLASMEQVDRLLDAIWFTEEYRYYEKRLNQALIGTMVFAGLRVSEVANLDLANADLANNLLHVYNGKGGKSRMVGMNPRLRGLIEEYLRVRPPSVSPRLFLTMKGTPLNRDYIIKRMCRLAKRTGLPVSAHALRRTFATLNANAGRSINLIQLALGHADLSTTQQYLMADQWTAARDMQSW